ncbi:hypothetical protein [Tunicatimonas pelagia]|uniref:hypothetical protein n=1 Tax=Tunicatimonas pelagia TaxID=931531 RepID=UPI0026669A92|nr:hypothetical protein [Tunicatimonas pelagia]WKN46497.1 hypothetical protein P0M28_30570 [Tunicatimonas pelagia]
MKQRDIKGGACFCHKGQCFKIEATKDSDSLFIYKGVGYLRDMIATVDVVTQRNMYVYTYWMGERIEKCIPLQEMSSITQYQYEEDNPFAHP